MGFITYETTEDSYSPMSLNTYRTLGTPPLGVSSVEDYIPKRPEDIPNV